jgi:hypothetical protein
MNLQPESQRRKTIDAITAKYVDTIREGKNFDYLKWFETLREEEAQSKELPAATRSGQPVPAEINSPANTSDRKEASANSAPSVTNKTAPIVRTVFGSEHETKSETPKTRLKGRLVKVRYAWNEFQASRLVMRCTKSRIIALVSVSGRGSSGPGSLCDGAVGLLRDAGSALPASQPDAFKQPICGGWRALSAGK